MFIQNRFLRLAACGRLVLLAGAGLLFSAQSGQAQVSGTPSTYNVMINEFSLCADSNCAAKTTIISSSGVFDLAGATPGAAAGDYVPAGTTVPSGTYSHFLISIAREIDVVGRITNVTNTPGPRDCITATASANGNAVIAGQVLQTTGAGTPGITTFTIPAINGTFSGSLVTTAGNDLTLIIPFTAPITVNSGEAMPSFGINFNITNAIQGIQTAATTCNMILGEPTITIVVGGSTLATLYIGAQP